MKEHLAQGGINIYIYKLGPNVINIISSLVDVDQINHVFLSLGTSHGLKIKQTPLIVSPHGGELMMETGEDG